MHVPVCVCLSVCLYISLSPQSQNRYVDSTLPPRSKEATAPPSIQMFSPRSHVVSHTRLAASLSSTLSGRRVLSLLATGIYQVFAPTFTAAASIMYIYTMYIPCI